MSDARRIACICGSRRFEQRQLELARQLTIDGKIVVMPNVFQRDLDEETKANLNLLHLDKVDLADEVWVVTDSDGYVGTSTAREIRHARRKGKALHWFPGTPLSRTKVQQVAGDKARRLVDAGFDVSRGTLHLHPDTVGVSSKPPPTGWRVDHGVLRVVPDETVSPRAVVVEVAV